MVLHEICILKQESLNKEYPWYTRPQTALESGDCLLLNGNFNLLKYIYIFFLSQKDLPVLFCLVFSSLSFVLFCFAFVLLCSVLALYCLIDYWVLFVFVLHT